jgi:hypothetical protein
MICKPLTHALRRISEIVNTDSGHDSARRGGTPRSKDQDGLGVLVMKAVDGGLVLTSDQLETDSRLGCVKAQCMY